MVTLINFDEKSRDGQFTVFPFIVDTYRELEKIKYVKFKSHFKIGSDHCLDQKETKLK